MINESLEFIINSNLTYAFAIAGNKQLYTDVVSL